MGIAITIKKRRKHFEKNFGEIAQNHPDLNIEIKFPNKKRKRTEQGE